MRHQSPRLKSRTLEEGRKSLVYGQLGDRTLKLTGQYWCALALVEHHASGTLAESQLFRDYLRAIDRPQGATFGSWHYVMSREARRRSNEMDSVIGTDIGALLRSDTFLPGIERAIKLRNALVHGEGPNDTSEFEDAVKDLGELIKEVLTDLEPLARYEPTYVTAVDNDPFTKRCRSYAGRRMIGDHPLGQPEFGEYENELYPKELYIRTPDDRLVLASPFLSVVRIPGTREDDVCVADRFRDGELQLQSLLRTVKCSDSRAAEYLGLLTVGS